mgnify:CR=1 FL=1
MQVNGVEEILARSYWDFAIKLTRAYRMQEGHVFNERVVQFVLDPEGSAKGSSNWAMLRPLWLALVEAVDDVRDVERVRAGEDK